MAVIFRGWNAARGALLSTIAREQMMTRQAVSRAAHVVERAAKDKLAETTHPEGTPTPSAPGNPPSLVFGNLRRSVQVDGPHPLGIGFTARVGPTAEYGRIQELGGVAGHGSVLPPRPYMGPALSDSMGEIRTIFVEAWRAGLIG